MNDAVNDRWVVLKFGGTSVAALDRWKTIATVVERRCAEGLRPLVVCSALGGVSNQLEQLIAASRRGAHEPLLEAIRRRHASLAEEMGVDCQEEIREQLETLARIALGLSLVGEASPRIRARIMALGELMSSRLGAAYLRRAGHDVRWLDVREVLRADDSAGVPEERRVLSASCAYDRHPALQRRLIALGGTAVITQGFIASNERGETVLLGRGGSDTSASYLAAKLEAERCEIWTDVPGMYTAQPQQIPSARLIRSLDYAEAQEIVSTGARVLHPRSIAPVREAAIPLHIRCTTRPDEVGTVIQAKGRDDGAEVKAISVKRDVMLVSMATPGMWQQVGFLADVFGEFKRAGLSIDLVSTSEMNVTVTLDAASTLVDRGDLDELVQALRPHCRARVVGPCATISLVGQHIRAILHELAPVFEVFEEQRVHLVSQAASDLNLSFVVDQDQVDRLVVQLHDLLFARRSTDPALGPSWQETFGHHPADPRPSERERPWWIRRSAELLAEAERRTPVYAYDPSELDAAVAELQGLGSVGRVLYAMKANPNPEILRRFERAGLGFETVSPGELDRLFSQFPALDPKRVLFTPNFAPRSEYERAFEIGVHVTVDALHPVERWGELFRGRELFVRIDPGRGRGHHEHVRTAGATSKFGVSPEQIDPLRQRLRELDARVVGLHAHLGSGIRTAEDWAQTALFLAQVARSFPEARVLDLGGGLGVPERPGQAALDLVALDGLLARFSRAHPDHELWLEPGRFLVARAGVLLTRVTQTKQKEQVRYVGVDAGMNSLIRPALYGSYHPIVNLSRIDESPSTVANVVGPICESGDTLGRSRPLPDPTEGDVLLIATVGAYGSAMSSRYNLREPAPEVVLGDTHAP